jgi:hypothetical protein
MIFTNLLGEVVYYLIGFFFLFSDGLLLICGLIFGIVFLQTTKTMLELQTPQLNIEV